MSKRRTLTLKETLPVIVRAVTKKKGIQVVFQGPPRTDGKTIYSNPLPVTASPEKVKIVVGDIDHECGHILFSDFVVVKEAAKSRGGVFNGIVNAIEDTFVERSLGERFLGCRETLRESVQLMDEKTAAEAHAGVSAVKAIVGYIDCFGRINVLGQDVSKTMAVYADAVAPILGKNGMVRLNGLLAGYLGEVRSTEDSVGLAGMIIKLLQDLKDEAEREQQQKQRDDAKAGKAGEAGSSGGNDGGGQNRDDSAGEKPNNAGVSQEAGSEQKEAVCGTSGQQPTKQEAASGTRRGTRHGNPQGQGTEGQSGANGGGGAGAGAGKKEPADPARIEEVLLDSACPGPTFDRRKVAEEITQTTRRGAYAPLTASRLVENPPLVHNDAQYAAEKARLSATIRRLSREIVASYQTALQTRQVVSDEGRVDSRRVHLAIAGEIRVFRKKTKRSVPKPAVSIVIDRSGSMANEQRLDIARSALIAVLSANETLSVPTEIISFGGSIIEVLKGFDASVKSRAGNITKMSAAGGTPTADAVWVAANRLAARREARKILILVTDGLPNDEKSAKLMVDVAEASGIEVYGVGIKLHKIGNFCTRYRVVSSEADIPSAVLGALRERIIRVA